MARSSPLHAPRDPLMVVVGFKASSRREEVRPKAENRV